nr:hypothetical protein [Candidatus Woesearchaeota archaeon]
MRCLMAVLLFYKKDITDEGDIIERKLWKVDKSKDFPEGIKYSFVYICNNKRTLGYDNERAKGHHKHYFDKEIKYEFVNIKKLFQDFEKDLEVVRKMIYGNKEN